MRNLIFYKRIEVGSYFVFCSNGPLGVVRGGSCKWVFSPISDDSYCQLSPAPNRYCAVSRWPGFELAVAGGRPFL